MIKIISLLPISVAISPIVFVFILVYNSKNNNKYRDQIAFAGVLNYLMLAAVIKLADPENPVNNYIFGGAMLMHTAVWVLLLIATFKFKRLRTLPSDILNRIKELEPEYLTPSERSELIKLKHEFETNIDVRNQ